MRGIFLGLALGLMSMQAAWGSADILYRFSSGGNGGDPFGALVRDDQGNLYGTTVAGCGLVFELSPPKDGKGAWTETVLHVFTCGMDGSEPFAGLIRDSAGNLYGTTLYGGLSFCPDGCGTVFEISPPAGGGTAWTETVLYRFQTSMTDGFYPQGGLVADADGNLYGTTSLGGTALGTVYELSPAGGGAWTETVLHNFVGADGTDPVDQLLLKADGTLIGTTPIGDYLCDGGDNCGTVFAISPARKGGGGREFSVLYRFSGNGYHGSYPNGPLISDGQGGLLGTTGNFGGGKKQPGNGSVFRLSPPGAKGARWVLHTLHTFTTDGAYPQGGLLAGRHGVLFGTAEQAGTGNTGNGLVYALSPPTHGGSWQETPLFTFPAVKDGAAPMAGLIADPQGRLYGTTTMGGSQACAGRKCGTVFRVKP